MVPFTVSAPSQSRLIPSHRLACHPPSVEPGRLFSDPTAAPIPAHQLGRHLGRPDPVEALARLRAGNDRFTSGTSQPAPDEGLYLQPFAIVVGCMDARVPVEAVFGQGPGAIYVARSAGHVLDRAVMGSIELAVTDMAVPLVVVLGHEDCRAVAAAAQAVRTGRRPAGARQFLIDQIAPAIPATGSADYSLDHATRSHIRRTVATLRQAAYLREALTARRLDIVGAIYQLESGHIEML
ncbi:carbonic anhydrase [Actinoplanes sp. NBC_00393]|uniref:carbonic anhydrase n=1 Tax=Actinoplanes sp. NBC_00393 TaxID=2975953 RepID=UPI002E1CBCDF